MAGSPGDPKSPKAFGKTGLPLPVLSPLVAFLRFQRTGFVPDFSCCQEPPSRLFCLERAPKSTLLAPEAPTCSAFRVCFTPETPVHFAFRALLLPEIRTRLRVRSSHAVLHRTLSTLTASKGFPLRKGIQLSRSPIEPMPSWRFPPLRLSLSSRWTRLPDSSSHVLGDLLTEASCGRNPRPPAPQSLAQRRIRLHASRPKARSTLLVPELDFTPEGARSFPFPNRTPLSRR